MTVIEVYPSTLPGEPLERHDLAGGQTLHGWLEMRCSGYKPGPEQPIRAFVNGEPLTPDRWNEPLDGTIEIRPLPRDPVTAIIIGATLLVGTVAYVMLRQQTTTSNTSTTSGKSLAGSSLDANKPKLNDIIPEIAGRRKIYPDYLMQPRTSFSAPGRQVLRAFLCVGVGNFAVEPGSVKIGQSNITEFGTEVGSSNGSAGLHLPGSADDLEPGSPSTIVGSDPALLNFGGDPLQFSIIFGDIEYDIELAENFPDADSLVSHLNGYVSPVLSVSHDNGYISVTEIYSSALGYSGIGIALGGDAVRVFGSSPTFTTGEPTTGRWIGPFKATPANEVARGFEIDLYAQNGLGIVDEESGDISTLSRDIEVHWWASDGASGGANLVFSGATRDQIGATYGIDIGAHRSNVYFRLRRRALQSTDSLWLDKIDWYGLKARLNEPSTYPGVTTLAVALDGSDEISSASDSKINVIVTRILENNPTSKISPWIRYICTDVGYSVDDIDNAELDALQMTWDARGDHFDYVVDSQSTVKAELARALRAGFAELTLDHGRIRPVRDQLRTDYEQMYTPQNMTSALQKAFSAYDPDDYDGVDVKYIDPDTWEEETVYCRLPGDAGVRSETIEADGICDRTRAWRLGMRERRAQRYRRRTLKFSTELDALNSRYLSYCLVCDDVPGYAQSAILVDYTESGSTAILTASEPLPWVDGASHVCALRRPDGTASGPYTATRIDDYRLSIAIPDFEPITGGSYEPTHILFGTTTRQGYPVLITEIAPNGANQVNVSAIGYDPRVYDDDDNNTPI